MKPASLQLPKWYNRSLIGNPWFVPNVKDPFL